MKETLLEDLFEAYFSARKNKRNTINALKFELNFESSLFDLYTEIVNYEYNIKPSICFIVNQPVKREIFAADFRDRIVHHLICKYLNPFCERIFIHDSYSCRERKGTLYGINRIARFIRSCSNNYQQECYILKMDISGYFMSMNKHILFSKIVQVLHKFQDEITFDFNLIISLIEKIIFNDPTDGCIIRGSKHGWMGLPVTKSLFYCKPDTGLAIGNLTSQMFSNIYLNDFDHFVKKDLKIRYYGRYVDDFVIIHHDKDYLLSVIPLMRDFLRKELLLELHPGKTYLQDYKKGVQFLGAYIKPWCIYTGNRTKNNFYKLLKNRSFTSCMNCEPGTDEIKHLQSSINSYLGLMIHFNTFRLRKKIIEEEIISVLGSCVKTNKNFNKVLFGK